MIKITDIQRRILQAAAGRDDGTVLPLPDDLTLTGGALNASLKSLEAKGLIDREVDPPRLADAGRAAAAGEDPTAPARTDNTSDKKAIRTGTKKAKVLALLHRKQGAAIDALMEETGWQAHSVRAALTGLRKDGHKIERSNDDTGITVYCIAGEDG